MTFTIEEQINIAKMRSEQQFSNLFERINLLEQENHEGPKLFGDSEKVYNLEAMCEELNGHSRVITKLYEKVKSQERKISQLEHDNEQAYQCWKTVLEKIFYLKSTIQDFMDGGCVTCRGEGEVEAVNPIIKVVCPTCLGHSRITQLNKEI